MKVDVLRTGVRCIHCGKGAFLVVHDPGDRWGSGGYYVTCSQGEICPWIEGPICGGSGRSEYPLTEEQFYFFKRAQGDLKETARLLRQYCPELRDAYLERFIVGSRHRG